MNAKQCPPTKETPDVETPDQLNLILAMT